MNPVLQVREKKITGIKVMNELEFCTNCVLSICSLLWAHLIGLPNNEKDYQVDKKMVSTNYKQLSSMEPPFIIYIKVCV